jgi:tRNA nucleotidyltransferase/poly(A) polymerase
MVFINDPNFENILNALNSQKAHQEKVYLVGGMVRDLLLGWKVHDYDVVVDGDVQRFAKQVADRLGAAYFLLNAQFQTSRIVWKPQRKDRIIIDLVGMRGNTIEDDLRDRDFTMNAMALDIALPDQFIDPMQGAKDIKNKVLRTCSENSLLNDPVRILRAIRLSVTFSLRLDPKTIHQIKTATHLVKNITPERVRDEIYKIFDLPDPTVALLLMEHFNLLKKLFPEIERLRNYSPLNRDETGKVWEHTLRVMKNLRMFEIYLVGNYPAEGVGNLRIGQVVRYLGRYREQLQQYFSKSLNPDRSLRSLLYFAALYYDSGKPEAENISEEGKLSFIEHDSAAGQLAGERARALILSNDEIKFITTLVSQHMILHFFYKNRVSPDSRMVYHFFNACGDGGIGLCLLSLADTLAGISEEADEPRWIAELEICALMMEGYWNHYHEWINPPRWLNGNEIKALLHINDGEQIGKWVKILREETAAEVVFDKQSAEAYLLKSLSESKKRI